MPIRLFVIILIVLGSSLALAQRITVIDRSDLQPLPLVNIRTSDGVRGAKTNNKGQAELSVFGEFDTLIFRLQGYEELRYSRQELQEIDFIVKLSEKQVAGKEIVVSASRWEQDRSEIANRITSVEARDVAFQNPQTAADLLTVSREVFVQKSQLAGGSPMIRGFSTNRVLIVVDGVRMNNAIFRSGNLQNIISLDPNATEAAEVIFGPGSVIYGSDAIGGVMDFHTLMPQLSTDESMLISGGALARYSTANTEKTGHLDLSLGWQTFGSLTSLSYSDYGDLRMGTRGNEEYRRLEFVERINGIDSVVANDDPNLQAPSAFRQINLMQKFRYMPDPGLDVVYGFHYSRSGDAPRYDRLIEYRNDRLRFAEWYYGPQIWMMNTLNVTHRATSFYDQGRLTLAAQHFEESRHDRSFRSTTLRNQIETVNAYSANLDFDRSLGNASIFYGVETILNAIGSEANRRNISTGEVIPDATRYPDGSEWSSYSAYLSYKNNLSEQFTLNAGARYNYVTLQATFDTLFYSFPFTDAELSNGALNGSLGLVWKPEQTWQINLNGATGFRAPNIDDVGKVFESEPGSVVVPNPDLKPEFAYSAELGIIKTTDILRMDASAFYTIVTDALARRDFLFNGQDSILYAGELSKVQSLQNVSEARSWGFQIGASAQILAGLSFDGHVTYIKGEETDDEADTLVPLRHAPPLYASAALMYTGDKIKAELSVLYNSEIAFDDLAPSERSKTFIYAKDENGNPYSPSWFTINLKGSYQLSEHFQISAGIENITDERYRPYSSGIVAAGRNFILGIRSYF